MTGDKEQTAVTTALAVKVGRSTCLVPRDNLVEVVRVPAEERDRSVEPIGNAYVLWLRGRLVSLLFVDQLLGLGGDAEAGARAGSEEDLSVVIVQSEERRLALAVDEILDSEAVELQSLPKGMSGLDVYLGTSVLEDGGVGLVLDIDLLSSQAGTLDERTAEDDQEGHRAAETAGGDTRLVVLLEGPSSRRMAIPLDRVSRLEDVRSDRLERSGETTVIQYRGELMPIHELCAALGEPSGALQDRDELPVVVVESEGTHVGFAVNRILDIVEAEISTTSDVGAMPGLSGAVVIHERVTDLIDVDCLVSRITAGTSLTSHAFSAEAAAPVAVGEG
jgi:two-component system chemotaxis sensor kinase CheA